MFECYKKTMSNKYTIRSGFAVVIFTKCILCKLWRTSFDEIVIIVVVSSYRILDRYLIVY